MKKWHNDWDKNSEAFKRRCFNAKGRLIDALMSPAQSQKNVFCDILNVTKQTEFGKENALDAVYSIKDFQKQVPIRDYDKFSPWIDREVEKRGGVLTNSPIARWLKTSGSTGTSKKIPYTKHWMEKYRVPALGVLWANYITHAPEILSHPYATLDTQTAREENVELLNGIPYQGITNRHPLISNLDWEPPWQNAPWFKENVPADYDSRMYYRLRYFLGQDLRAIFTINPSTLIALHHHLIKQ